MQVGDTVHGYRILGRLGEGGMGVVWTASRSDSSATVAIKGIQVRKTQPGGDSQLRKRLGREARILMSLDHPNIVKALEMFVDDDELFLVLEHVAGTEMSRWLSATPAPSLVDRLTAVRHVFQALEYAHDKGVTHRDLKPGNVMIADGPVAKVLDFGLAKALDSTRLTRTGVVMGTLSYMAPEQGRQGAVEGRADLYSAGMLIARCLELTAPFQRGSPMTMYGRLISPEPVQLDAWLPRDVREFLSKLLEKDPQQRMASASEAAEALDRLLAEGDALAERLQQARDTPASERRAAPVLTHVDRPELSRAVDEVLAGVTSRKGGALLVLGHPGSGRSAAVRAIAKRLTSAGTTSEREQFVEAGAPHMLCYAFLGRQGLLAGDTEGSRLMDAEVPATASSTAPSYEGSVDLFLEALRRQAARGRFALLLDDLQFAAADESPWLWQLLLLTREVPLVVVLTGDVAAEGAGSTRAAGYGDFLTGAAGAEHIRSLTLAGLAADVVVDSLVAEGVSDEVAQQVASSSAGNPRLVNLLLERWHQGDDLARPGAAPDLYMRRLRGRWQQLEPAAQQLMKCLLDAGGRLSLEELAAASGLPRLALKSRLRELERKHAWVRVDGLAVHATQPFLATLDPPAEPPTVA